MDLCQSAKSWFPPEDVSEQQCCTAQAAGPPHVPPDVLRAASLLGEHGCRLIALYHELSKAALQLQGSDHGSSGDVGTGRQQNCGRASVLPPAVQRSAEASSSSHACWWPHSSSSCSGCGSGTSSVPGQLLSKRTVMDNLVETHDARVLQRWAAQQEQWQRQAAVLAAATGRNAADVSLACGPDWRCKQELLAALGVAAPAGDAAGGSVPGGWMASLHNANEQFVQVGNLFSGLTLAVRHSGTAAAAALTTIRTPGQPALQLGASHSSTGRHALPGCTWREGPYLQAKLAAAAGALRAQSHAPAAEGLVVLGQPLGHGSAAPVSLTAVLAALAVREPGLAAAFEVAQQAELERMAEAASAAAEQARRKAARAAAAQLPRPGPHLQVESQELSLHYVLPSSAEGAETAAPAGGSPATAPAAEYVQITNTGTAAVYYSWTRVPAIPQHVSGCDAAASASHDGGRSLFYLADRAGVVLPGQAKAFRFCFTSPCPGVFQETWQMHTHPPLAACLARRSKQGDPIAVMLRGVAVAGPDGADRLQEQVEARLTAQECDVQVQGIIHLLLDGAFKQATATRQQQPGSLPPAVMATGEGAAAAKWAAANPAEPSRPLFYSTGLACRLADIHANAVSLLQPPTLPEPKKPGGTAPAARASMVSGGKAKEASASDVPDPWDSSVASLVVLVDKLATTHKQESAVLRQQLEVALEAAAIPQHRTQLVEAACRYILSQLAETVAPAAAAASAAVLQSVVDASSMPAGQARGRAKMTTAAAVASDDASLRSSEGSGMHRAARAAAAPPAASPPAAAESHNERQQGGMLYDVVRRAACEGFDSFAWALASIKAGVAAALDRQWHAAAHDSAAQVNMAEACAHRQFVVARTKHALHLA